jgi:hypothetical protein
MNGYEARLAAFADGRRLFRLRHPIQNDDGVPCDACGSAEPRWLHLLKDDATGRYAMVGGNCVRALADLGVVRRRVASEVAAQAYVDERALRQADLELPTSGDHGSPFTSAAPTPSQREPADLGRLLVAAVAVLGRDEWATLLQMLPLGAERWRFLALDGAAVGLEDLIVIGVNGSATGEAVAAHSTTAPSRP